MRKPNIIYILMDDFGYGDASCYGARKIRTPNIDQLAEKGMRFTDAHSPSAVCTPTRYSILTGTYCWRSRLKEGVLYGESEPLIEDHLLTVPSFLKQHGYATSCIGKWHLGLGWAREHGEIDFSSTINHGPINVGFDYFYGISASLDMPPYCFIENDRTVDIPTESKFPEDFSQRGRGGLMTPGWQDEQVNTIHTEKAVSYIDEHVKLNEDQPFFMYLALTGPHTPWTPAKEFQDKSGIGPRGDLILEMDWSVGEIMKTLKRLNIQDDTLLIFTSDNGPHPKTDEMTVYGHQPAGDMRGQKADIWEGGHRVPFIASWPAQMECGAVNDDLICLTDLMATCAAIIGKPLPAGTAVDSYNILPALLGESSSGRGSVIHHSYTGMFSIRRGDWKYIEGEGSGGFGPSETPQIIGIPSQGKIESNGIPAQLYNVTEDFSEKSNVYLEHPEIVNALRAELHQIQHLSHDQNNK